MREGMIILDSEVNKLFTDENEARNWVRTEYPFENVRKGDRGRRLLRNVPTIRDVIGKAYAKEINSGQSSLRGFWFVSPIVEKSLSNRKMMVLRELMLGEVGLIKLEECSVKILSDEIVKMEEGITQEDLTERLELLHLLLDHALKAKYIKENVLATWSNDIKKIVSRRRQAREALGKNSLSIEQLQKVFEILKKNVDDPRYLGLMIQMFTGLSANETCGLTIDSIDKNSALGLSTLLSITHEATKTGNILPFDELHRYRWIPCPTVLGKYIQRHKLKLESKVGSLSVEEPKIMLLSCLEDDAGNTKKESQPDKSMTVLPQNLRDLSREIIREIGIEPFYITLQDEGVHPRRTNINAYYGEILKSNFEYYARRQIGMMPGEYAYIVGNVQKLVKDKNYIDYSNVHSQRSLLDKLERWERIISRGLRR